MIETIDNILQQEQLQSFKEVVESKWFPWNFLDNSAYPDDKELIKQSALNYSFYHMCWDNSELMSNYFNKFALIKCAKSAILCIMLLSVVVQVTTMGGELDDSKQQ